MKTAVINTALRKHLPRWQTPNNFSPDPIKSRLFEVIKSNELTLTYSPLKGDKQIFNIKMVFPESSDMSIAQLDLLLESLEMLPLQILKEKLQR